MLNKIIENSYRLTNSVQTEFVRDMYDMIDWKQGLIGIVGQRGVGKTTLMLQYLKNNPSGVYFSADNINIAEYGLYKIIETLYLSENIQTFFIDEIHKYQNWNQELKNIYDTFPGIHIVFSGSSSIDLIKGKYDLSRRLTLYRMKGFSFREYLNKVKNIHIAKIGLEDLITNHKQKTSEIYGLLGDEILFLFKKYLQTGYYPFSFESDSNDIFYSKLIGTIDKVIYEDISNFYQIDSLNLEKLRKIIIFYALSNPGELSINALKNKLSIAYDTTANYLQILTEVGLLQGICSDGVISKQIRKAEKIFIDNTNIIHAIQNENGFQMEIGTIREVFFVNQVNENYNVFFSDIGDFLININGEKYYFEVGGKHKTKKQLKDTKNSFVISDDIIFGTENRIPLYLFGLLS